MSPGGAWCDPLSGTPSVQVDGVKDPLCKLLKFGSRVLRLLLEPLVLLPQTFDLSLKLQLLLSLLTRDTKEFKINLYLLFIFIIDFLLLCWFSLFSLVYIKYESFY